MRHYETCFTGTDAVDVVLQRLYAEKVNFSKDVSRDKAIKVSLLGSSEIIFRWSFVSRIVVRIFHNSKEVVELLIIHWPVGVMTSYLKGFRLM